MNRQLNTAIRATLTNLTFKGIIQSPDGKNAKVLFIDKTGKAQTTAEETLKKVIAGADSTGRVVLKTNRAEVILKNLTYSFAPITDNKKEPYMKELQLTWELCETKKLVKVDAGKSGKKAPAKKVTAKPEKKAEPQFDGFPFFAKKCKKLFKLTPKLISFKKNIKSFTFSFSVTSKNPKFDYEKVLELLQGVDFRYTGLQFKINHVTLLPIEQNTNARIYSVRAVRPSKPKVDTSIKKESKAKSDKKSSEVRVSFRKLKVTNAPDGTPFYRLGNDEIKRFNRTKSVSVRDIEGNVTKAKARFTKTPIVNSGAWGIKVDYHYILELGTNFLGNEIFLNAAELNVWLDINEL